MRRLWPLALLAVLSSLPSTSLAVPVRFVSGQTRQQFKVTARIPDDVGGKIAERDEQVDPVEQACSTPCALDLPPGPVLMRIESADREADWSRREVIVVPPRPTLATVAKVPRSMWSALASAIVGLALVVVATPLDFLASACWSNPGTDCVAPIAISVALTVSAVALDALGIGLFVVAARRPLIALTDEPGHAARTPVRFSGLGPGPSSSPGLSLRFSF